MKKTTRKRVLTPDEKDECARLKALYKAKKKSLVLTQESLASLLGGMHQSAVSHYLNGINALNKDIAAKFALALGVNVSDFSPRLAKELERLTSHSKNQYSERSIAPGHTVQKYPVIDWFNVREWLEGSANDCSDIFEWSSTPAGPFGFWVKVCGDSMSSPVGLSIPEGMLILVNPSLKATSGRLVIAKFTDIKQMTFKRYVEDSGRKYLKPLNPAYKIIEIDAKCEIIGVVVEAKWDSL